MPATVTCAPQGVPSGWASPRSAVYRRRQPERTLLYRTVQTHLATWLALHDDGAGATAPALTEREFRRYLDCGILAHGFARASCADCGVDAPAIAVVQAAVQKRLLRSVEQRGLLSADSAQTMADWEHDGGFSVDAASTHRGARARRPGAPTALLRPPGLCARPAFALERLREIDTEHLVYESVKPGPGGSVSLMLTPMPLLDHLAALIPPPRKHRHRYYGVAGAELAATGPCHRTGPSH